MWHWDDHDDDDMEGYQPRDMPTCRHCGVRIIWLQKNFKWVPSDVVTGDRHTCPGQRIANAQSDFEHLGARK